MSQSYSTRNDPNSMRLLSNAQAALLSGFKRTFGIDPEVIDIAEASNHAARLVAGGEGAAPEWRMLYGKRRIVWL